VGGVGNGGRCIYHILYNHLVFITHDSIACVQDRHNIVPHSRSRRLLFYPLLSVSVNREPPALKWSQYVKDAFPTTGALCIENQCALHLLAARDTCASIAASAGIFQVHSPLSLEHKHKRTLRVWHVLIPTFVDGPDSRTSNPGHFIGNTHCIR
jgi:hypothetical protein